METINHYKVLILNRVKFYMNYFEKITKSIKKIFKKEVRFPCIIWDGKTMTYLNLTQEEIDKRLRESTNKELRITKKDEISHE